MKILKDAATKTNKQGLSVEENKRSHKERARGRELSVCYQKFMACLIGTV
jgi:hypothetical protein